MRATGAVGRRLTLVALMLAVLAGASRAAPVPKDDEKALREKALKLNQITGEDPIRGMILTLLENKEGTKKLLAVAHKMAKDQPKDKPPVFNINATWILARAAHQLKEVDVGEFFYRENAKQSLKLYSSKKFVNAYEGLLALLYANERYADVEKACKDILELPGDENIKRFQYQALERLVQSFAKQGKSDQALKTVNNLLKAEPDNLLLHRLKGWVLRESGKYDEAVKTYHEMLESMDKDISKLNGEAGDLSAQLEKDRKALKELESKPQPDEPAIKALKKKIDGTSTTLKALEARRDRKRELYEDFGDEVRYTLSGVYIDLKDVRKATEQLQALLKRTKKNEENPTYNNDLGFIMADNDMNLDEAERLIRKAIEEDRRIRKEYRLTGDADKDNAAYLDSLGWVLYKKKKYKDALPPLLEAIKQEEGQHLEIYDHLAEVYIALGEPEKALDAWKKGLSCKPVSKRDGERKIEVEKKMKKYEKKD